MFPRLTINDCMNCSKSYSVFSCYETHIFSLRMLLSYFKDLFFCQFSAVMVFSESVSSFFNLINMVFFISPNKKMIGSNTLSIITSMKYAKVIWNSSMMDNPRKSMSVNLFRTASDKSISTFTYTSNPIPAVIRFFNVIPKSIFQTLSVVREYLLHRYNFHRDSFLGDPFKLLLAGE